MLTKNWASTYNFFKTSNYSAPKPPALHIAMGKDLQSGASVSMWRHGLTHPVTAVCFWLSPSSQVSTDTLLAQWTCWACITSFCSWSYTALDKQQRMCPTHQQGKESTPTFSECHNEFLRLLCIHENQICWAHLRGFVPLLSQTSGFFSPVTHP